MVVDREQELTSRLFGSAKRAAGDGGDAQVFSMDDSAVRVLA